MVPREFTFGFVLIMFGLVQASAVILTIVLGYHCRKFLPGSDHRAKLLMFTMKSGIAILFVTSGFLGALIFLE